MLLHLGLLLVEKQGVQELLLHHHHDSCGCSAAPFGSAVRSDEAYPEVRRHFHRHHLIELHASPHLGPVHYRSPTWCRPSVMVPATRSWTCRTDSATLRLAARIVSRNDICCAAVAPEPANIWRRIPQLPRGRWSWPLPRLSFRHCRVLLIVHPLDHHDAASVQLTFDV